MVLEQVRMEAIQKGRRQQREGAMTERRRNEGGLFPTTDGLKRFPAHPQMPAGVLERWIRFWLDSRAHHLDRHATIP